MEHAAEVATNYSLGSAFRMTTAGPSAIVNKPQITRPIAAGSKPGRHEVSLLLPVVL